MGAGSTPSLNVSAGGRDGSSGGRRVEAVNELAEDGLEAGIVVLRVSANEVDDFAIAVRGLSVISSDLVDHAEAIPAVVHIGEAFEQIEGRLLGLIEPAVEDEFGGSVGRSRERVPGNHARSVVASIPPYDSPHLR